MILYCDDLRVSKHEKEPINDFTDEPAYMYLPVCRIELVHVAIRVLSTIITMTLRNLIFPPPSFFFKPRLLTAHEIGAIRGIHNE